MDGRLVSTRTAGFRPPSPPRLLRGARAARPALVPPSLRAPAAGAGARTPDKSADPPAQLARWAAREAGTAALATAAGGPNLPQAFGEDTVVAVDKPPPYIRALDELFARHEMEVVWYGHAATGL